MIIEPLRNARDNLSDFVDRAEREHERTVVTRNGRPAAVLIGYADMQALDIDEEQQRVVVLRVEHRADAYRPR